MQRLGALPSSVKIFTDQSAASDNIALSELLEQADCLTDNIVVFDRGLSSRKSYDTLTQANKFFVTRGKRRCEKLVTQSLEKTLKLTP